MGVTAIGETFNAKEDKTIDRKKESSEEWLSKVLLKELVERKAKNCDWDCSDYQTEQKWQTRTCGWILSKTPQRRAENIEPATPENYEERNRTREMKGDCNQ
jgi:hypothetical protein